MIKYIRKKGRKNFVWENEDYSNGIYTIEKKNFGNKSLMLLKMVNLYIFLKLRILITLLLCMITMVI